jgi:hypothetical protein
MLPLYGKLCQAARPRRLVVPEARFQRDEQQSTEPPRGLPQQQQPRQPQQQYRAPRGEHAYPLTPYPVKE